MFAIEGEMTIYTAETQRRQLEAYLASGQQLELDLSQVSEIDSAGLQLLIWLKNQAAQADKTLNFVMHSPAIVQVLELTNLSAYFGDPLLLVGKAGAKA